MGDASVGSAGSNCAPTAAGSVVTGWRQSPRRMADFVCMEAMADSALPFVRDWCSNIDNRRKLEVAYSGMITACRGIVSRMHWCGLAILCSIASRVVIPEEDAQQELTVARWISPRAYPSSVATFAASLPSDALCLWFFELTAALSVLTDWLEITSPLLRAEDHYLFRHVKVEVFDVLGLVRVAASGREPESVLEPNEMEPEVSDSAAGLAA
eukprot:s1725_g22.t1